MIEEVGRVVMTRRLRINGEWQEPLVYDGEVPVEDVENLQLKEMLGDAHGRVGVAREASFNDYGTGGKVMVSVSLAHDQSPQWATYAKQVASYLSRKYLKEEFENLQQDLRDMGIVR